MQYHEITSNGLTIQYTEDIFDSVTKRSKHVHQKHGLFYEYSCSS